MRGTNSTAAKDTSVSQIRNTTLWLITAFRQRTDYRRWSDPRSLYASWEPRTKMAAALVPNNSRVIEFGAGNRNLERHLDPTCSYTPSDMVERGPGTIVCDLNERPLPDLGSGNYDVAVILGVLEYVRDMPSVLDWLTKYVTFLVLAYAPAKATGYSPRAVLEKVVRLRHGWMSNYREDEILSLFRDRGFQLVEGQNWHNQRIFVFSLRPPPA